jgi:hypothetical protein
MLFEWIEKLNGATNILAFGVITLGVAISFKSPATGHDLVVGGLGLLGGSSAAARNQLPNQ